MSLTVQYNFEQAVIINITPALQLSLSSSLPNNTVTSASFPPPKVITYTMTCRNIMGLYNNYFAKDVL